MKQMLASLLLVGFLIGVHNGQIGVWRIPDPEPMRTIPCPIWVLSQKQQQLLQQGIRIESMTDLEKMMTDFFP